MPVADIQVLMHHRRHGRLGSDAFFAAHFFASAAFAWLLVELTQGTPMSPWMPSQMTTGWPPQGLVTVKFLNWMLEHTALGLQVRRATALPNFPDVEPDMFSKTTLVMLTRDGCLAHVAVSI
jgi:hypothetical protein